MQTQRVTQRDIARAAGVSRPTVSLALRRQPGIPLATRDRIVRLAEEMGYVPDPTLSALASYRWPDSSGRRVRASLALIDLAATKEVETAGYPAVVRRGALDRARALGFGATVYRLADYGGNLKRLLGVLRNRGVGGVILLPVETAVTLDAGAGWDDFSVVAATTSVLHPRFHRVVPNQLQAMTALLEALHATGYRRIGAIFSASHDRRTDHAYGMALAWFGHHQRVLVLPDDVRPEARARRIGAWLRKYRPDFVLSSGIGPEATALIGGGSGRRRRLRQAALSECLEQFPELIGETAVRVLSGIIYGNEKGIPLHPEVTTIDGAVRPQSIPLPGL